eukprot:Skav231801  [mRNA]  locus=scaffold668:112117:117725:- [translate_table: standard]
MKLMGIGKHRFNTLGSAARQGNEWCPYDLRYTVKEKRKPSEKWNAVHSFLTKLYVEVAEPIPDGMSSNKRPRQGDKKLDSKSLDRSRMKHLPYGTIGDYHRQCVDEYPNMVISRKLFCSVMPPKKRTSSTAGPATKAKAAKKGSAALPVPPDAMQLPHIKLYDQWVTYTMPKFINHDGLAEGLLNHGYCSAQGFLLPWKQHLTNGHSLLNILLVRMEKDWVGTAPKMRKPWGLKDLEP